MEIENDSFTNYFYDIAMLLYWTRYSIISLGIRRPSSGLNRM